MARNKVYITHCPLQCNPDIVSKLSFMRCFLGFLMCGRCWCDLFQQLDLFLVIAEEGLCCLHTGTETLTLLSTPENSHYTFDHVVSSGEQSIR